MGVRSGWLTGVDAIPTVDPNPACPCSRTGRWRSSSDAGRRVATWSPTSVSVPMSRTGCYARASISISRAGGVGWDG